MKDEGEAEMKRIRFSYAIAISAGTPFRKRHELRGRSRTNVRNIEGAGVRLPAQGPSFGDHEDGTYAFTNIAGVIVLEVRANGFAASASRVTVERVSQEKDGPFDEAINETVSVTGTHCTMLMTFKSDRVLDTGVETKREIGLSESLRGIPGVRVQQQGSPGALTSVRLRGQRTFDTALLLDGLRVRDASYIEGSALPLFADLAPADLDRVEVLRGSGSSIYGSNAIGGAINLVPATTGGDRHFEFGFDGGSLAQFRERVAVVRHRQTRWFQFGLTRVDVRMVLTATTRRQHCGSGDSIAPSGPQH